ncbi:hypothetical protein BFJ69_g9393 [Fusarium oxysporum]|uniref:Uncharacterized protein n=1 Tax=Fusarium oxysporum TaxID=5507 RepID=A0A420MZC1_FUSOX|nr:hypothetical protein BFJ69_g9393 [Fusarium oxysporum]
MAPPSSSRALERATSTSSECSPESIFANTGILIHPWETTFCKKHAKVATKTYRLIGEYVNIWLGDINPEYWTLGTLESLYNLLSDTTRDMHDPDQRREKFGQIKVYLAKCAVVDAWRGMKPTLYPKRLQDAQLCFSPVTKDPTDENTVVESEKSEAEPSIPSPERPQPNPVTRKHPATESLPEAFSKQPRQQQIAVSAMAGDNTEFLSTDCDLIFELKQYQDGAMDNFLKLLDKLLTLASTTVARLACEREVASDRVKSQVDGVANTRECFTKLKDATSTLMADMEAHVANEKKLQRAKTFIEAASPEVWSTVLRVHEDATSNTSAALEEKCYELEVVQAHLGKLIKELEETRASIYITDEKVERVAAQ